MEHCWGEIPQECTPYEKGFSEMSFFAIVAVVLIWKGGEASGRCYSFGKGVIVIVVCCRGEGNNIFFFKYLHTFKEWNYI